MHRHLESGAYFGVTTPFYCSDGLSVAESVYPAGFAIPAHEHSNSFFCFVLAGLGTRSWPGRAGAERPMSLTLFPAGHAHANYWADSGGRVLHVEFGRPWLERLREQPLLLTRPGDFDRGPPTWLARRLADETRQQDSVRDLAIEGLVLELLAECTRADERAAHRRPPGWLSGVRSLLHDRFAETLALTDIAASAGVSADHLGRVFRKHIGCSVGTYVRRLRIEYACERLAGADVPLADIAAGAGFTDQSHFTRVFRELTGSTPADFRARHSHRFRTKRPRFPARPKD